METAKLSLLFCVFSSFGSGIFLGNKVGILLRYFWIVMMLPILKQVNGNVGIWEENHKNFQDRKLWDEKQASVDWRDNLQDTIHSVLAFLSGHMGNGIHWEICSNLFSFIVEFGFIYPFFQLVITPN